MKVALPVWENRISPVFDFAHVLLIAEIENRIIKSKKYQNQHSDLPYFSKAAKLSGFGVKVLICGAVSQVLEDMIESYEIQVISSISGSVDEVLQAYLTSTLSDPKFRMPGWRKEACIPNVKGELCWDRYDNKTDQILKNK
ncbi:MAG: NifB/NifX family molybdenum-iron cluster-binding protein [Deltaproteobacteria bacterium]|nr:NifB/NifX family molybdenum-iron cluster-binding protein [Deltaproteobacteria bacterium]